MKIGIISDTHGKQSYIKKAVDKLGKIDILIHLGDHSSDAEELRQTMNIPVYYVRGNCDFCSNAPDFLFCELAGRKFYITHGHLYQVGNGISRLLYKGQESGADIVLYGHTHVPAISFEDGILFMNPGSVSCPRSGKRMTAGIISIIDDKIVPYIVNLNE